jgi:hypothetical protein
MEKINKYSCQKCGGHIVTVDRIKGTTPMMLGCRAKQGCTGTMMSHGYSVSQDLTPTFEWYKPTGKQYKKLDAGMKQHVDFGGLVIRPISV